MFFADGETPAPAVVVPQLASASLDPLATAVVELLPARRRRLLPAPEPGIAAARVRSWYRDAWFARAEVERRSLVAATGQGAACLAALLRDRCTVTAAVREPLQAMAALAETGVELPRPDGLLALGSGDARALKPRVWLASNPQSRALLSGLAETDDLPVTLGPPPDAERWRVLLLDELATRLRLFKLEHVAGAARDVAMELGHPAKRAARAADAAEERRAAAELPLLRGRHAELLRELNWLDAELYERAA